MKIFYFDYKTQFYNYQIETQKANIQLNVNNIEALTGIEPM